MRTPLLLHVLLACAVSLTLGRAASIDKRDSDCDRTIENDGYLMLYTNTPGSYETTVLVDFVNAAPKGTAFGRVKPDRSDIGTFYFNGCPGDALLDLYCRNCNADTDFAPSTVVACGNDPQATGGAEPGQWNLYSYDVDTPLGASCQPLLQKSAGFYFDGVWMQPWETRTEYDGVTYYGYLNQAQNAFAYNQDIFNGVTWALKWVPV